jgi:acetyltransferase
VGTAAVEKPVLILKGGRVRKIFKCAVVQARGILVRNLEEMLAGANVLSKQPPMPGKRVAILTNLKGLGAIALRYLEEYGLVPARPTEEVSKRFAKKIPSARMGEFVDLGISAEADRYKFAVEQLISDENVDGMMIICGVELGRVSADELLKVMERGKKDKPIVGVVLLTERRKDVLDALARAKTPIYREVESAAAALKISNSRHEILLGLKKVSKG